MTRSRDAVTTGPCRTVIARARLRPWRSRKPRRQCRLDFSCAGTGRAAIVFDNRNSGASGGEPRQEINPRQQVEDDRDAISFARSLPEIERIGVRGFRCSGGHIIVLAAIDRRIKCLVSQVPLISGQRIARRLIRADPVARPRGGMR